MEIRVKVRFNASKEKFETYGKDRYLIYLPFEEDKDSQKIIIALLSRKVGTPENRILFTGKDAMNNWIFEVNWVRPHRKVYKYCRRTVFMVYTEVKKRNMNKYYYRVVSLREGNKVKKTEKIFRS